MRQKRFIFIILISLFATKTAFAENYQYRPVSEGVDGFDVIRVCRLVKVGEIENAVNYLTEKRYDFTNKRVWHSIRCQGGSNSTLFEELTMHSSRIIATKNLMREIIKRSDHETLKKILNCTDNHGETVLDWVNLGLEISDDQGVNEFLEKYKALFIRAGALTGEESKEGYCLQK